MDLLENRKRKKKKRKRDRSWDDNTTVTTPHQESSDTAGGLNSPEKHKKKMKQLTEWNWSAAEISPKPTDLADLLSAASQRSAGTGEAPSPSCVKMEQNACCCIKPEPVDETSSALEELGNILHGHKERGIKEEVLEEPYSNDFLDTEFANAGLLVETVGARNKNYSLGKQKHRIKTENNYEVNLESTEFLKPVLAENTVLPSADAQEICHQHMSLENTREWREKFTEALLAPESGNADHLATESEQTRTPRKDKKKKKKREKKMDATFEPFIEESFQASENSIKEHALVVHQFVTENETEKTRGCRTHHKKKKKKREKKMDVSVEPFMEESSQALENSINEYGLAVHQFFTENEIQETGNSRTHHKKKKKKREKKLVTTAESFLEESSHASENSIKKPVLAVHHFVTENEIEETGNNRADHKKKKREKKLVTTAESFMKESFHAWDNSIKEPALAVHQLVTENETEETRGCRTHHKKKKKKREKKMDATVEPFMEKSFQASENSIKEHTLAIHQFATENEADETRGCRTHHKKKKKKREKKMDAIAESFMQESSHALDNSIKEPALAVHQLVTVNEAEETGNSRTHHKKKKKKREKKMDTTVEPCKEEPSQASENSIKEPTLAVHQFVKENETEEIVGRRTHHKKEKKKKEKREVAEGSAVEHSTTTVCDTEATDEDINRHKKKKKKKFEEMDSVKNENGTEESGAIRKHHKKKKKKETQAAEDIMEKQFLAVQQDSTAGNAEKTMQNEKRLKKKKKERSEATNSFFVDPSLTAEHSTPSVCDTEVADTTEHHHKKKKKKKKRLEEMDTVEGTSLPDQPFAMGIETEDIGKTGMCGKKNKKTQDTNSAVENIAEEPSLSTQSFVSAIEAEEMGTSGNLKKNKRLNEEPELSDNPRMESAASRCKKNKRVEEELESSDSPTMETSSCCKKNKSLGKQPESSDSPKLETFGNRYKKDESLGEELQSFDSRRIEASGNRCKKVESLGEELQSSDSTRMETSESRCKKDRSLGEEPESSDNPKMETFGNRCKKDESLGEKPQSSWSPTMEASSNRKSTRLREKVESSDSPAAYRNSTEKTVEESRQNVQADGASKAKKMKVQRQSDNLISEEFTPSQEERKKPEQRVGNLPGDVFEFSSNSGEEESRGSSILERNNETRSSTVDSSQPGNRVKRRKLVSSKSSSSNGGRPLTGRHIETEPNSCMFKECYICHEKVDSTKQYIKHLCRVHSKATLQCPKCGCGLLSKAFLAEHLKSTCKQKHSEMVIRCFRCKICPLRYTIESNLKIHLRKEHGQGRPIGATCEVCERHFTTARQCRMHQVKCRAGTIRVARQGEGLECPQCGKLYSSRQSLYYHIRMLHNFHVFECLCGKKFRTSSYFYAHKKKCAESV